MTGLGNIFTKLKSKGSAAIRVAEHDAQLLEAKGKLIAFQAAEKVANDTLNELEAAAAKVHAGRDAIAARISALNASL